MSNSMTLWQPDRHQLVPRNARTAKSIAKYVDTRTLNKLANYEQPRKRWSRLVKRYSLVGDEVKDRWVSRLIAVSSEKDEAGLSKAATKLLNQYYGKKK